MSEAAGWDALSRLEQRALIKLFGGGSLRRETPAVVEQLRARALVDERDALSRGGLFVLTLAMRRQQEVAQSREDLVAEKITATNAHNHDLKGLFGVELKDSLWAE